MTPITSPPRAPSDDPPPPGAAAARTGRRRRLGAWLPLPMMGGLIGVAGGIAELLLLYFVGSSVRALVGLG